VLVVEATQKVPTCPRCGLADRTGTTTMTFELQPDDERLVMLTAREGAFGTVTVAAWSIDDRSVRAGAGGLRVVGSSPPLSPSSQPNGSQVEVSVAYDGCVRVPPLLTPEPVLSVLSSVPANDTAEAWFGYRQISPFSPPFGVFWSLLPDRPTGGVLTVIIDGPVQLPPATEGPPVPLTSPAMTLPNCSAGAS
jgi:hypothetical protein